MRCAISMLFLFCWLPTLPTAQIGIYQHGTVVKMRMGDCLPAAHGFISTFGGPANPAALEACPEYTLVSDRVVFVIVGKMSNQLIPLAQTIDFRMRKNQLAVRVDDAGHESKFTIKEMVVRSEWDRVQQHIEEQMKASEVGEAQR